ncbi:MAG: DUF364 domain-containing protein [Spirochaetota bacterium]|nr:DUF364 domain-containing protein [Spirochaetota bacterium]
MDLNDRLYEIFKDRAKDVAIDTINIGLGYTAVETSDGGIGISYTYFESKRSCSVNKNYYDYEGKSSLPLLDKIKSEDTIQRSMALALINALNYRDSALLPEDPNNYILFDKFGIKEGTRAAMVGFFGPLIQFIKDKKAFLEVIDRSRNVGSEEDLYIKLEDWAEVLFLTSTSILNNTTEIILGKAGKGVKTVMLGPSTPLVSKAFDHLPVNMLAGTVVVEREGVLKAIRHGAGAPVIHRYSRKSYLDLS